MSAREDYARAWVAAAERASNVDTDAATRAAIAQAHATLHLANVLAEVGKTIGSAPR